MTLHIYNSLTRAKERFKSLRQDEVKVYYCGPTPYNYAHIGNLRAYLFEDFTIRTLRYLGYRVKTVMNITDIDDKTIRDSRSSGKTLREFTEFYTAEFLSDLEKLRIKPADTVAPISGVIPEMETLINGLIAKGYAYVSDDGSVYYRVEKFKKYGELAHLDTKGMISSVRIDNDEYDKDQVADFALWKAYDAESDGPNKWEIRVKIPWRLPNGETNPEGITQEMTLIGRPGWHIECSACNYKFFGEQIDIHMGGIDNLFPHHQNEVAQTEAFTGKQFAKYWMHGGHLLVDNRKMSKSAGNFFTLRDIVEKYADTHPTYIYRGFRLMALQNQYRENFNFTFDRLDAAINTIKGLDETVKRLGRYKSQYDDTNTERNARGRLKFHNISREFRENQQYLMQSFVEKLEDDIDTVSAMTVIFELQSMINWGIDNETFSLEEAKSLIDLLMSFDEVLGVFDFSLLDEMTVPAEILELGTKRLEAKLEKNWSEADRIRDEIGRLGWKMIDEKDGKWHMEPIV